MTLPEDDLQTMREDLQVLLDRDDLPADVREDLLETVGSLRRAETQIRDWRTFVDDCEVVE